MRTGLTRDRSNISCGPIFLRSSPKPCQLPRPAWRVGRRVAGWQSIRTTGTEARDCVGSDREQARSPEYAVDAVATRWISTASAWSAHRENRRGPLLGGNS